MASSNVKAVYTNRLHAGHQADIARRNARKQKIAALKTIPRKRPGSEVVAKADADQKQYDRETGDDDATHTQPADVADQPQGPDASAQRPGAEAPASDGPADGDAGKDAEPLIAKIKRAVKGKKHG